MTLFSAFFLGLYEVSKKLAVRDNAVTPVLFFAVLTSAVVWTPFVLWSAVSPDTVPHAMLRVAPLTLEQHGLLALKSLIVGISWALTYWALKHLPISIASPIRSTGPLWTILIATVFWGEQPTFAQCLGIILLMAAIYAYSYVGSLEGIHFHRDRWIAWMTFATFLSACSGLYDKYLLQNAKLDTPTVQAWFSIDLVFVVLPQFLLWCTRQRQTHPFRWRPSIVWVGVFLLIADFVYFSAIQQPDALISLISPLRRMSVLVSFGLGIVLFREREIPRKAACLALLLVGVFLISTMGRP